MSNVTEETRFVGRSGCDVVIHRYDVDDYSAWITDDVTKDTHGCSVRGSLVDIMEEIRDELPARKIHDRSERLETLACIIELFEDFLEARGIDIPNEDKDQAVEDGEDPDCISLIYGCDYGALESDLEDLLIRLGMMEKEDC